MQTLFRKNKNPSKEYQIVFADTSSTKLSLWQLLLHKWRCIFRTNMKWLFILYTKNAKVTRGSDLSLVPRNPWLELEEGGVRPRSANWCHWMILVLMVTERMCCIPSIIFSTSIIISTSHHIIIDTSKYYKVEYGQNVLHTKYCFFLNKYYHLSFTSYHHRH